MRCLPHVRAHCRRSRQQIRLQAGLYRRSVICTVIVVVINTVIVVIVIVINTVIVIIVIVIK